MELSRQLFDVGLITNQRDPMLAFWRDEMGLPLERKLTPTDSVVQYKLTLKGAVLKLNCVTRELPHKATLTGLRMLMLADPGTEKPRHVRDPDGNLVCLVPPGYRGIHHFGMHSAVSDEAAFHHFYGVVLQLPSIGDRMYEFGGATLSFAWSPDVVAGASTAGIGFHYLTFQVMDVAKAHAELLSRGAKEEKPPSNKHTTTDSTISFILDPDGNSIEISQRPDLVALAESRSS
jgi:catechol 2,3-dioxygenase-like lactoylglutathione lyase family enzyme